jgi:signal transduction histidine kinase/DNA-binding response OmpR family regulator
MFYRFKHRILGPLVILWLVLTVASVVKLAMVWNDLSRSLQASAEATAISDSLEDLFITLQEAESAQRGFLLTANDAYLEPFQHAETVMPTDFTRLAALTAADHAMQVDLLELHGLVQLKLNEMRESIKLRRDKGLASSLTIINATKSRETMDKIRQLEAHMRQQRFNLVSSAGETMRLHFEQGQTFGIMTGVIGIGAGLFALYLFSESYRQMKSQRELLMEKLRAEETVVEKSAFLANMSHEIRTPMNAILGFGELLEQEPLTPRQAQYARSIRQSGKSLLQLINDVLDLSKMEAGKMELFLEPTDVRELCGFLQTMFAQQAAVKSLQLGWEIGPAPRSLLLDRLRLRQLLVNLVGNAVKFTEQGSVKVRVNWLPNASDKSRGTLAVDVSDTGVGISPEKQEEIFKPFVQSEPGRAAENQGSGLGLSIVQRLLRMMGGSITVDSAVGHGSEFHLRLDNVAVSARLPVGDAADEKQAVNFNDFRPATVLVVDDNEINRDLIAGTFERTHHQLTAASNGREALEKITRQKPDVVLLDLRMPVLDGRATLAEIRKLPGLELLPVIAVTASSEARDEEEIRGRFNGFLRKPFSRAALYEELAGFLPRVAAKNGPPDGRPPGTSDPGAAATAKKADDWQAVSAELSQLRTNEWPGLRDTLAIRESQTFAQKLRSLAQANQCAPLAEYADTLTEHAETFAVAELEKHLADFPELVDTIQRNSAG